MKRKISKAIPALFLALLIAILTSFAVFAENDNTVINPANEFTVEAGLPGGSIGNSSVMWSFDSGRLLISGCGSCDAFSSKDDQPWAEIREQITEVSFESIETLTVENLEYWFEDCTSLSLITFCCRNTDELIIRPETLTISVPAETTVVFARQNTVHEIASCDREGDNRNVLLADAGGVTKSTYCYLSGCKCSNCSVYYSYTSANTTHHYCYAGCTECSLTYLHKYEPHSYDMYGVCINCGHYNSDYDTTVCYHGNTTKTWSGCNWTEYCSDCGKYINSGTTHGSYSYDAWQYDSSMRHRRYYYCNNCNEGSYEYGDHAQNTRYAEYSSTHHSKGTWCDICNSYIGSVSYENHNIHTGNWNQYSNTQHRRQKNCYVCGFSEYEYAGHNFNYGSWIKHSNTQHKRNVSCFCGYSATAYAPHNIESACVFHDESQHRVKTSCPDCSSEISSVLEDHIDGNHDGYCDGCSYLMTVFSVTIPANLSLVVSETGEVFSSDAAVIINNSTGTVAVTGLEVSSANGWMLVPYDADLASAKVDSRLIGFSLNGSATTENGTSEALSLNGGWTIESGGSLPLNYDAVVSAMSAPINEQVLTVVFVLSWAS